MADMAETTDGATAGSGGVALKVVTVLWLVATALHLMVWIIMCAVTTSLDHSPFWIWPLAGGALVVVPWYLLARSRRADEVARR